jgi:hypothetical protein
MAQKGTVRTVPGDLTERWMEMTGIQREFEMTKKINDFGRQVRC